MTEPHQTSRRRILVAMDMSPPGTAALDAAARLAVELRAELHGLFIEDADLLRIAGLPFAREIDGISGTLRPLDPHRIEETLRKRAEAVRKAIAHVARELSLHWSFQISRGSFAETMLNASLDTDLLLVGREQTAPSSPASRHRGPIMIVDDGTGSNNVAFDTALHLARQHSDALVVLLTTKGNLPPRRLADVSSPVYVQRCSHRLESLLRAVSQWQPQLLVLDRSNPLLSTPTINGLVTQLPCPLVVVP